MPFLLLHYPHYSLEWRKATKSEFHPQRGRGSPIWEALQIMFIFKKRVLQKKSGMCHLSPRENSPCGICRGYLLNNLIMQYFFLRWFAIKTTYITFSVYTEMSHTSKSAPTDITECPDTIFHKTFGTINSVPIKTKPSIYIYLAWTYIFPCLSPCCFFSLCIVKC